MLEAYKTQIVAEQDHAILKGPLAIAPVFLKDTKKVTAYAYRVFMALLLWQLMPAVARQNTRHLGISIPHPNGRLQDAPTTKRIKEILTPIQVIHYRYNGEWRRARSDLTLIQRQALLLLGMSATRFTAIPSG